MDAAATIEVSLWRRITTVIIEIDRIISMARPMPR